MRTLISGLILGLAGIASVGRAQNVETVEFMPRDVVAKYLATCEWLFDLKLTEYGRKDIIKRCDTCWKEWNEQDRDNFASTVRESHATAKDLLATGTGLQVRAQHDVWLYNRLNSLRGSDSLIDQFWLTNYESVYGSDAQLKVGQRIEEFKRIAEMRRIDQEQTNNMLAAKREQARHESVQAILRSMMHRNWWEYP